MSQRRGKGERVDFGAEVAGFRSGGLGGALGEALGDGSSLVRSSGVGEAEAGEAPPPVTHDLLSVGVLGERGAVRLRLSRSGRGGHTVTLLESDALTLAEEGGRAALARALGEALGCRAWWDEEGQVVCLQGDQRGRAQGWLVGQGVGEGRIKRS